MADELRYEATHDALTGLPNRVLFAERLAEVAKAGVPVALAFIDLDEFKDVNDSRGHDAGDELLRLVAGRLVHAVRPGIRSPDSVATSSR